jgi:hypothetical protein
MTILHEYKTVVDCDDSHCSLRYYKDGETLSIGIVRSQYYNGGKINGLVVTVSEWNVGELLYDIEERTGVGPNEMVDIVNDIKADAVRRIREHLTMGIE